MSLAQFRFEDQNIRFVVIGSEVYFVAKDIATILGYQDTAHAVRDHIDKEDTITDIELRRKGKELSLGHFDTVSRAIYTNESGVYSLIFGSTKPEAKTFKRWLTKEVLPSIRKTGSYSISEKPKRAVTYYSERLAYLKTNLIKPDNTWCVIEKCSQLLLDVEHLGYKVNQFDLLDLSVGKRWLAYRKDKDWTSNISKATYKFNDVRGERIINAYEYQEVGYFVTWLDSTYQTKFLPKYLREKYGNLVKV